MTSNMESKIDNSLNLAFSEGNCRSFFKLLSMHPDMSAINLLLTFDKFKDSIDYVAGIGEWQSLGRNVDSLSIPGKILKPSINSNGNLCFTNAYVYSYLQTTGNDYFDLEIRENVSKGKDITNIIDVLKHFNVDVEIKELKDKPYSICLDKRNPISASLYLSDVLSEKNHDLIMVRVFIDILYMVKKNAACLNNTSLEYEKTVIMFCICTYFNLSTDEMALKAAIINIKKDKSRKDLIAHINHISYMYNLTLEYIKDESYLSSDALIFLKIAIFKSGIEDESPDCLNRIDKWLETFLKLNLDDYYKHTISILREQLANEFDSIDTAEFLEFKEKVITNQIKGFPRYKFHYSMFDKSFY